MDKDRLPPGQYLTTDFPTLDLGVRPQISKEEYNLTVDGEVTNSTTFSYQDLLNLPQTIIKADFHCVSVWSKYDVYWQGVLFKDLISLVQPTDQAQFIIEYGYDGYTTNNALSELMQDNVLIALKLSENDSDSLTEIPIKHGGPVRFIIPHLYAWKGSKFLKRIQFLKDDELGFWEIRGYHNRGDPWNEERYSF